MKPQVILDIGFLGHAHDDQSGRRGAQRVAGQIFESVLAAADYELAFVATSHLAGAYDFLQTRGLAPDQQLKFQPEQLRRSRWGRNLTRSVHRTLADRSFLARAQRRLLATLAGHCLRGEKDLPRADLSRAAIYHSPHTPFPAAVHAQTGLRKFLTCHDFIPLKNPEYFPGNTSPFMAEVLRCLTPQNFAFCVSETTRQDVLNLTPMPPERVFVTPLAADPALFYPVAASETLRALRHKFKLGEAPYFLALSALDRHKNFAHLIRCFGALVEAGELREENLVIVGANPGRNPEAAEAIAQFPRARNRILIPGFVPDEDLAALYSGATAFLFPSLAEGFGIPPLEAMQCGTPVIASNTTSMPEVIGDAGILLSPTDRDAWSQNMLNVVREAALRAALREKSLQRCQRFSWERFNHELLRGYQVSLAMS